MKTIKNDYCIRQFVGDDEYRPYFSEVNFSDGFLYSTNSHIVGKIKADLCVHEYKTIEKYPNCEAVMSKHISIAKKTVSVDELFNDLIKIEVCFKPKMIKCENCNGDGVAICEHCDSEYDCKECKGTGEVKSNEIVLSSEHDCILFDKKYKLQYLDLIIRTAVYTGVKEIEISNDEKEYSGSIFTVGDFTIMLMPLYNKIKKQ